MSLFENIFGTSKIDPKDLELTSADTTKKIIASMPRKKAEEIYNARVASGEPGNHESDWLNAEKALKLFKRR